MDYGFKYASELQIGDKVQSQSGDIYEISNTSIEKLDETIKVYNFEVEDWHTYYVTSEGILVHNMCKTSPNASDNSSDKASDTVKAQETTAVATAETPVSKDGSGTNQFPANPDDFLPEIPRQKVTKPNGTQSQTIYTSQCFVAGTKVKTEDGDKNIEDIEVGDKVYSCNHETGEAGLKEVKQTFINIVHLEISNKDKTDVVQIDTTEKHPFYVVDYGFKYASELQIGDKVKSLSGDVYEVTSSTIEYLKSPVKVYNFEVEDWHTYFFHA